LFPKFCKGCEKRFVATAQQQHYCGKCKDAQHAVYANPHFVGVDGEGVTRPDGTHDYVLLSVGTRSLYNRDGSNLSWYEIIPFLWDCFTDDPNSVYVGFYLGYDFTQWLRDLPENRARILLTTEGIKSRSRTKSGGNHLPFPVEHRGWKFDMLGMKRFRLWRDGDNRRMYICDTGSYFQTSFLNAIDPKKWPDGPILSDDEYKKIAIGKSERGEVVQWGTPVDPEMIEYNLLENDVLSRLMTRYAEGLKHVGLSLKRDQWFGPGQAAQTWMNGVKAPTRTEFEEAVSVEIRDKCRRSYYGGWFEIFAHGHIPGESWSYDINSAYPDIQSQLPCCLHGVWREYSTNDLERIRLHNPNASKRYVLAYCTIAGSHDYMGCAMFRLRTGHILRPQISRGWYWLHEIQAGQRAGIIDNVEFHEGLEYDPCDCTPPFRNLRSLYRDRIRIGKNTSGGKARKLIYNSTYGKTAQSIGAAKYANPFYASLITSYCRTYLINAVAVHPFGASDILMCATDGITFRRRNPNLQLSEEELGMWSETRQENLTLFMPGIYWDDETRKKLRDGQHPTLKSRGVPGKVLGAKVAEIDRLFSDSYSGHGFPVCDIPIGFSMVSPKQALARGKWDTCGNITHDQIRHINSDPSMKRLPITEMKDGIIRSFCYANAPGGIIESTPYNRTFGDKELQEILTPDGNADMLLHGALESP
jgi:hypothetical protein